MKIAFIGGRDIHKLGGIEAYTYNLCTELVKMGHEPIVFCESDRNAEEWVNGFKVVHQKSINSRFWNKPMLGLRAINKLIRDYPEIDIYHFNAAGPAFFAWYARIHNKITIYEGHGLEWKRTKYSKIQRRLSKVFDQTVIKFFTKYHIAVSQEQSDYWGQRLGVAFKTIPTAVNPPNDHVTSKYIHQIGADEGYYYLYLGRLVQDKNPDYLIRAFVKANIKGVKLVVAGSNDTDNEYVKYLKNLASENVIFTGAVYGEEKESLLKCCRAFCIPSTIEGMAITLLEAMSYGRICIASDIPANREALGDNGVWVRAENEDDLTTALIHVDSHYTELSTVGENNRKRVIDNFLWDKVSKKYIEYVETIKN